jgi:hypothetical protein
MVLVDWSGAIFGPGSEWFWIFAQFIVVTVTLVAIYRQLRLQASERAIEQLAELRREAYGEQMLRWGLDLMIAQRDHKDPADVPDAAVLGIGDYWGTYATLARAGHRDVRLLWLKDSVTPQMAWHWLSPWLQRARSEARPGETAMFTDLEWLSDRMAEMDREAGRPAITAEVVAAQRSRWIAFHEAEIRYAVALRTDHPEANHR